MNIDMKSLSPIELKHFKKIFEEFTFSHDFHLFFEQQVPNAAIILLEGRIEFNNRRKKCMRVANPGILIGVENVLKGIPFKFNCLLKSNSTVLMLSKSQLLEIMEDKKSPLNTLVAAAS